MTIYSLDVLLSLFGISLLFHVRFCCFLNHIQVSQETGKEVCYSRLFKNFPQFVVNHTFKRFGIISEAEVVFLKGPCFIYDPTKAGNLISDFFAFSKPVLYIWKVLVHVLLKPSLKDCEHNLTSMWNKCYCAVVWTFFGIVLLWDWNENWPFAVLWPLLSFPNLLASWVQHFNSIIFYNLK